MFIETEENKSHKRAPVYCGFNENPRIYKFSHERNRKNRECFKALQYR